MKNMLFKKLGLKDEEHIIAVIRRHWFFLFKQCFFVCVVSLLPLVSFFIIESVAGNLGEELYSSYLPHTLFLYAFWLLLNVMMLASIWTDHYLDVWVLTNRRIININQVTLFRRQVGSFQLERLQDLNVEVHGIIETLLDFGTIHAETASGSQEEFKARHLPKPQEIKSLILREVDKRGKSDRGL